MTSSYFIFAFSIGCISSFTIIFSIYLKEINRTRNTAFIFLLFFTTVYILLFYLLFNQFLLHQYLLCQILLSEFTDSNIYTFLFMLVELSVVEYFVSMKHYLMLFFNQDNLFNYDILFIITYANTVLISAKSKTPKFNPLSQQCTAIVPWGQYLPSSVGLPQFNRLVANMIEFPPLIEGVVVGILLSDGICWFKSPAAVNANLKLKQSFAHGDYVLFCWMLLWHYCKSGLRIEKGLRNNTITYGLYFTTRALPCFTYFRHLFYPKGVKVIPHNIYDILTPVALAHLIMGDGCHDKSGLVLCTDSYSIEDNVRLINVLIIKYELECTIQYSHGKPRIYIRAKSMAQLRTIVKPFMHPTFYYKIHLTA